MSALHDGVTQMGNSGDTLDSAGTSLYVEAVHWKESNCIYSTVNACDFKVFFVHDCLK